MKLNSMEQDRDNFYLDQPEPNRSCLLSMRDLIHTHCQGITETRKYGMPCFCYEGKAFCYLWTDKKSHEPYFLLVEGKHLNHPALETGNRSRMKILRVNPDKDLPISTIKIILDKAIDFCKKKLDS